MRALVILSLCSAVSLGAVSLGSQVTANAAQEGLMDSVYYAQKALQRAQAVPVPVHAQPSNAWQCMICTVSTAKGSAKAECCFREIEK